MTRLRVRPRADLDISQAADYYAAEADINVALRFLDSVQRAFARILEHSFVGARMAVLDPGLSGLRAWPVPGFEVHLVHCFAEGDLVDVVRVLHGARDVTAVLAGTPRAH